MLKMALEAFSSILVSSRKHMENDPVRPPPPQPTYGKFRMFFLQILFKSFPFILFIFCQK